MQKQFVVLIPARSGSQRISNKNDKNFANSSLLEIKIKQANFESLVIWIIFLSEHLNEFGEVFKLPVISKCIDGSA